MIAYASSLDQGGPLARTAEDCALMLGVMAGFDPKDSTSVEQPVDDYLAALQKPLSGLRIGLPREYFGAGLDSRIADAVLAVVEELKTLGATVKDISLPNMQHAIPAYYVIAPVRGVLQPVALRRRALWLSLRRPAEPGRPVQALARGRLRQRSEEPHHGRHLRTAVPATTMPITCRLRRFAG